MLFRKTLPWCVTVSRHITPPDRGLISYYSMLYSLRHSKADYSVNLKDLHPCSHWTFIQNQSCLSYCFPPDFHSCWTGILEPNSHLVLIIPLETILLSLFHQLTILFLEFPRGRFLVHYCSTITLHPSFQWSDLRALPHHCYILLHPPSKLISRYLFYIHSSSERQPRTDLPSALICSTCQAPLTPS